MYDRRLNNIFIGAFIDTVLQTLVVKLTPVKCYNRVARLLNNEINQTSIDRERHG